MNSPKKPNLLYIVFLIVLGFLCIIATVSLTFYSRNDLKNYVMKTTPAVPDAALTMEVNNIEREIKIKEVVIKNEKSFIKMDELIQKSTEESIRINAERIKKIEKLEAEISALELKRVEFKKLEQESIGLAKGSFDEEYNIEALAYIIGLGVLSLGLAYATFIDAMPRKNGAAVNLERKAFLFFVTAVSTSAFGFALYLWYLSI